jgi:hypothetical protein
MKQKSFILHWIVTLFFLTGQGLVVAQQVPDTTFIFANPASSYGMAKGPVVMIDAAHHNFHTLGGGFTAFGRLLTGDGFRVQSLDSKLTRTMARPECHILVIANALDASDTNEWISPNPSAFTREEISNLQQWVLGGGRLLLIADHMPFAGAANELASAFGFRFVNGFAFTSERSWPPSEFTRGAQSLGSTPVTDERKGFSWIDRVATFTGSAFRAPEQAIPVLKFNEKNWSLQPDTAWRFQPETPRIQLDGYSQGALLKFGKGKVAIFGEAAMFTAQIVNGSMNVGFNSPDAPENAAFVLNVIRWLDTEE